MNQQQSGDLRRHISQKHLPSLSKFEDGYNCCSPFGNELAAAEFVLLVVGVVLLAAVMLGGVGVDMAAVVVVVEVVVVAAAAAIESVCG